MEQRERRVRRILPWALGLLVVTGVLLSVVAWRLWTSKFRQQEQWVDSTVVVGADAKQVAEQLNQRGIEFSPLETSPQEMLVIVRMKYVGGETARQWTVDVNYAGLVTAVHKRTIYTGL